MLANYIVIIQYLWCNYTMNMGYSDIVMGNKTVKNREDKCYKRMVINHVWDIFQKQYPFLLNC